jgi:hypothetical protein
MIAAQDLGRALQGRENPWDPLPEAGQLPWEWVPVEPDKPGDKPRLSVRSRAYAGQDEWDAGEPIRLQAPVIRDAIPKLLRAIGVKDPREMGQDVGPGYDLKLRMSGIPSVLGVEFRHGDERLAREALERAVRYLEALAGRMDARGSDDQLTDLVTLDQCAALVNRKKRTLENYKKTMPRPKVPGGGGKPHEYAWSEMRPWLEKTFGRSLPQAHPDKPKSG